MPAGTTPEIIPNNKQMNRLAIKNFASKANTVFPSNRLWFTNEIATPAKTSAISPPSNVSTIFSKTN